MKLMQGNIRLLLWVAMVIPLPAFAQQARLDWTAIQGAVAYELEISRNGQSVVRRKVESPQTHWTGNLPYGVYAFRLRAIDWAGQEGEWSEAKPFLASPPPPHITSPAEQTSFATSAQAIVLQWQAAPETRNYRLEITRNGEPFRILDTELLSYTLSERVPGTYQFRVRPLIVVASASEKKWEGEPSPWRTFKVLAPEHVSPNRLGRYFPEVQVSGAGSVFRLNMTDNATTGRATLVSNVNLGATVDLVFPLAAHHAIFYQGRFLSTSLKPPGRTLENAQNTVLSHQIGYGFRLGFLARVAWRIGLGLSDINYVSISTISPAGALNYSPIRLFTVGLGVAVPIYSLLGVQLGARAQVTTFLSRIEGGESYRNGVEVEGALTLEGPIWRHWRWQAYGGYRGLKLNARAINTLQDEIVMGAGVGFRWE